MPLYAKLNKAQTQVVDTVFFDVLPPFKPGGLRLLVDDAIPVFNAATQKVIDGPFVIEPTQVRRTWQVVILNQAELDALADATEKAQLKALVAQIKTDLDEAQAFIDLVAPTAQQRNDEVKNAAQREKRLNRAIRFLVRIS